MQAATVPDLEPALSLLCRQAGSRLARYYRTTGQDGEFPTPVGKARFSTSPLPDVDVPAGQLVMMTIRTHDQFNTTVYGLHDRYRGIHGERRIVLMNADDLKDRGLTAGDALTQSYLFAYLSMPVVFR